MFLSSVWLLLFASFQQFSNDATQLSPVPLDVKVNPLLVVLACCCSNWQRWNHKGLCFTAAARQASANINIGSLTLPW